MFFTLIMLVVSVCFLNFCLNNAIVHIVLYVYVCEHTNSVLYYLILVGAY